MELLSLGTKLVARSADIEWNCAYYVPSAPAVLLTLLPILKIELRKKTVFQRGGFEWLSMKLTGCGGVYSIFNL